MKLLDLDPHFVDSVTRVGIAIMFKCPHCKRTLIEIPFENPLDGKPSEDHWPQKWKRTGDDFSNLSLDPEIRYPEHINFMVINGEIHRTLTSP